MLLEMDPFKNRQHDDPEIICMARSCLLLQEPAGHWVLCTCSEQINANWEKEQSKCPQVKRAMDKENPLSGLRANSGRGSGINVHQSFGMEREI